MATTSMVLVNGSTADSALEDPVPATSVPTTGYLAVPKGAKSVMLYLGGYHDTTPADNDYAYQVVLWRQAPDPTGEATATQLATPQLMAKGVATLGTLVMQDASGDTDYLYADTITNTLAARPDVLVFSPADNTMGWIYIEFDDAVGIELENDLDGGSGTAVSSVYAFARFSEETHPFFLNSLLSNKLGGFSGDGGAASDDSVKAALDLVSSYTLYDGWRLVTKAVSRPTTNSGLFTVTGLAEVRVAGVATESVVGDGGNASVGTATSPELLIENTVNTNIDNADVWIDATPDKGVNTSVWNTALVLHDTILLTVGDSWGTTGAVTFVCLWKPRSSTATVVAA